MLAKALEVKKFRELLLSDPTRPGYHFCVPEQLGTPGDPNGCFYANGRYHMMYLYRNEECGYCWGHVSSVDLLHWRHHPDCIMAGIHGKGCFSGGAFLDDDGKCYISFWDFVENERNFGALRIAVSIGEPYEKWELLPEPIVECNVAMGVGTVKDRTGKECIVGAADPSNIWKKDGVYYVQTGNLCVLDKYSRGENPPEELRGDWSDLFSTNDFKKWSYEGRFYDRENCLNTADSEDCMCPSFLPLPMGKDKRLESGKYLQLFIAHNRGCQYYTGTYDKENNRFLPEKHGRMSIVDSAYFAPEAVMTPDGRQIMWNWLRDDQQNLEEYGWCGVYGMARELWYEEKDQTLRMAPAREYEALRINPANFKADVQQQEEVMLPVQTGDSFEMKIMGIPINQRDAFEIRLRISEDGTEYTSIYFDRDTNELVMDTTKGSAEGWPAVERMPVSLETGELLTLDIYVDHSVIEVYANDRAAICRRVYPKNWGKGVAVSRRKNGCILEQIQIWEMAPCNSY